jgi:5-hydroxyisourate hydrolase
MSPITVHILDTALGVAASGVPVLLSRLDHAGPDAKVTQLAAGTTNADGRLLDLLAPGSLQSGVYQLRFDTSSYFARDQRTAFYPSVSVVFEIRAANEHYHVPLLLSPYGYSTYRGT